MFWLKSWNFWEIIVKFAAKLSITDLKNMKLKITKGLNLRLAGVLTDYTVYDVEPKSCAVVPDDFPGFTPKLLVKEGDAVMAGSALMYDKFTPEICLVSPVSGTVTSIVRGERRKILRVVVENDRKYQSITFDTKAQLTELLGKSGFFTMMRRRPYDIVPDPRIRPRDIFVTGLDTAPLACPLAERLPLDAPEMLASAVKAMSAFTDGKIYISVGREWNIGNVAGAEMVQVSGPHPAGNVGIQIANIAPVSKGENVWTLDIVTLYKIGKLLATGVPDYSTLVAVVGSEVAAPRLISTVMGADMPSVLGSLVNDTPCHKRVISGNVLTGTVVSADDGYLRFPWRQVTVIAEGDDVDEFMGWANLSPSKISISRALPFHGLHRLFSPDARLQGGRRAMIMSGEYDKVMPADIMVEYLLKAILGRNIDDMEALGIYEVAPEDLALCEFVDTSKLPVQQIVRDGLDFLRKELE